MEDTHYLFDAEELDYQVADELRVQALGFSNLESFGDFRQAAINGLLKFGGSFAESLGVALIQADLNNAIKIIRYWNQECEQHSILYRMYLAKLQAEQTEPPAK